MQVQVEPRQVIMQDSKDTPPLFNPTPEVM